MSFDISKATQKTDVFLVHPDKLIVVEGRNIRPINEEWVAELKTLMAKNGFRKGSVLVCNKSKDKEGYFEVKDGHHRTIALQQLASEGIHIKANVQLANKTNEEQSTIDQIIANTQLALTPLDWAEGVGRLFSFNWNAKEISDKLGRGEGYINRLHSLYNAPKKFKDLVDKVISGTEAMNIIARDEVESFLQRYEAGEFTAAPSTEPIQLTTDQSEAIVAPEPPKQKKITARKINGDKINSWKSFGKWAKNVNENLMPAHKKELFSFLCKMMNNQANELDFAKYFKE